MAARRKRQQIDPWSGSQREDSLDNMFAAMRDEAVRRLGRDDVSLGTEDDERCVGLPLPALALRYLFQSNVFPLSRITQITGEEGSCKSAFLFEMMRWHHVYGGGSAFIENEDKDSPELRKSILQWNPRWLARHEHKPTYWLEDWQDALTGFIEIATAMQDSPTGPGRTVPTIFGVDSLMATAPKELLDKIIKEGHASRNFALAANLIAAYMRTMPAQIKDYPFSVVGTNHLKPSTDFMGRPTNSIPGGKAVKFMETYEIEMHRGASPDIDLLEYGGLRLRIIARKNSLGPSRKQIFADLLWWYEEVDGVYRQRTAWDWDTASIELLMSFEKISGKKTIFKQLQDICKIVPADRRGRMAACPTLGFNEPVEYRRIGAALERRRDLLDQLYRILGIAVRPCFRPGEDYRDMLEHATPENEAMLYEQVENMPVPDVEAIDPLGVAAPTEEDMADIYGDETCQDG